MALELPELSPRELAVRFTDDRKYFGSEASVYRLLKANDLITSPAYVVIKAANEFKDKTTAINQLWQTEFTHLKIAGWGWYYLSTVLDDFSRYIVTWRLGPTMCASDVPATLNQALAASGLDDITVTQRPRLLSDNGASYVAGDLATWLKDKNIQHVRGAPYHPQTQGFPDFNPIEPLFAKLKHWLRRAAERAKDAVCTILNAVTKRMLLH
jgi:RNA-directed DNA polymerase